MDRERDPVEDVEDPSVVGEPLETEEGVRVPAQQNVGAGVEEGGGEWPDPDTPPTGPASGEHHRSPGEPDVVPEHGSSEAGPSGFKEVLEADPVVGGSASTPSR